jgi:release factor glutamine methyltransferase
MEERPPKPDRWTVKAILEWTADYFRGKGMSSGRLDAEILLAHALELDRLRIYLNLDRPLLPEERQRYRELVRRRAQREPVALITGRKEFWSIPFHVIPGVLIPRPDTETLVEAVIGDARSRTSPSVLEIGTGTGAVAVAVAKEIPDCRVTATDLDTAALGLAERNSVEAGVRQSISFVASDLFEAIRPGPHFDIICSNPPYIPAGDIVGLEPEVRLFEPIRALDGGPDGLDVIRRIVQEAGTFLKEGGRLFLEIGDGQAAAVSEMFESLGGLHDVRSFPDLAGIHRVVGGKN